MAIRGKMTSTSVLVERSFTTVTPAPSYEGKAIGRILQRLIEETFLMDHIPDVNIRVAGSKHSIPSMRLIRSESCIDHTTGIIQILLRPAAVGFCKDYDQKMSFGLDSKFEADGLPQITKLTLGHEKRERESWKEWIEVAEAS